MFTLSSFLHRRLTRLGLVLGLLSAGFILLGGIAQAASTPVRASVQVGETCFATPDNGTTVFSSTTAQAVRDAVGAASVGGVVKFTGYCTGAITQSGSAQVVLITKTLTLAGGYTLTNWTTPYPLTQPTTLDAQGGGRVISTTIVVLTLQGFTLTNGYIASATDAHGGGLYAAGAATLLNMVVVSNVTTGTGGTHFGGGAYVAGAANVQGTTFRGNRATTSGGGGYFANSSQVSGTTFTGNWALASSGGGAFFQSLVNVTNTLFMTNTAELAGGGAYFNNLTQANGVTFDANTVLNGNGGGAVFGNTGNLTNTLFNANTALNNGGGALFNSTANLSATTFSANVAPNGGGAYFFGVANGNRLVFRANTATDGGGAYLSFGFTRRFTNTLFAGNQATGQGTALYVNGATPLEVVNTTIAHTTLAPNPAIYVANGTVFLTNTLVASHTVGVQNIAGAIQENYNLFANVLAPTVGAVVAGGSSLSNTAGFYNTLAYTLTPSSTAINRGTAVNVPTDFFGDPRPQNGAYDIGYDETPYSLVYGLIPVVDTGGNTLPYGPQAVPPGGNLTFSMVPNAGYHVENVLVDGVTLGAIPTYTFSNVTTHHILTATFGVDTYLITPTTNAGGNLTPNTPQMVNYGDTLTFTTNADIGHHLVDVRVDGVSQGAVISYTFYSITTNHTISALFASDTFIITPSAGLGGNILPSTPQVVNYGSTFTFTIAPNTGYTVANVLVDEVNQGIITSYAFNDITASHTISAFFTPSYYDLNLTILGNGQGFVSSEPKGLSCNTNCSASFVYGSVVTLTATPLFATAFAGWGGVCSGNGTCAFTINGPRNVTATFTTRRLYLPSVVKSGPFAIFSP